MFRPWAQRQASGDWNQQIWVAAVRYQRPGPIGLARGRRADSVTDRSRESDAPAAAQSHRVAARVALSAAAVHGGRRTARDAARRGLRLRGERHGLGRSLGCARRRSSTRRRCARDASSPAPIPPRFDNVVVGGGVTPFVGLRVGGSVTRGGWQRAGETRRHRGPRRDDRHHRIRVLVPLHEAARRMGARYARDHGRRRSRVRLVRAGTADADAALVRRRARRTDVGARHSRRSSRSNSSISMASRRRSASG